MGVFSYICVGCGTGIRHNGLRGELAILKHIRHGIEIETIQGEYNGYGAVVGADWKDSRQMLQSVWGLEDSIMCNKKYYKDQLVDLITFRRLRAEEEGIVLTDTPNEVIRISEGIKNEWNAIPKHRVTNPRSGVEAWHQKCYHETAQETREAHIISKDDSMHQGWGQMREEFMQPMELEEESYPVFNEQQMKRFMENDLYLRKVYNNLVSKNLTHLNALEILFNSNVIEDASMEDEYAKYK